jgi:hypothetical protein
LDFYLAAFLVTNIVIFFYLESAPGVLDRQDRVRGRDFLNFYVNGWIVASGNVERLYDHEYFLQVQETLAEVNSLRPRYYPVYPPTTALFFSPLSRLPYGSAIVAWWLISALCFAVSFWFLFQEIWPPRDWRRTVLLALAAFTPVMMTFWNGQLAGFILLLYVSGLRLHHRGRLLASGLVFSLLALKPQLATGVVLWLLLMRDVRTMTALALGVLIQVALTSALLGPEVYLAFVRNAPIYFKLAQIDRVDPSYQHALAGILSNLFGQDRSNWWKGVQAVIALYAAYLLWQVLRRHRTDERWQGSALTLFTLFASLHLLVYDLSLLLIPIVQFWRMRDDDKISDAQGIGGILYLSAMLIPVYELTGFSLVPVVILWALYYLAHAPGPQKVCPVGVS